MQQSSMLCTMHVDKWLRAGSICVVSNQLMCGKECIPEHEQISIRRLMATCTIVCVLAVSIKGCLQLQ